MIIKPLAKDEAQQRWPWLTAEALADEEYWAYLQRWAYNPPPHLRQPLDITAWLTRQTHRPAGRSETHEGGAGQPAGHG